MDDLLATNPVAPLPLGILSFNQRLTDVVITYLDSKAEAELAFRFKQSTALGKLIAVLLMGVYGLQGINSQQPVLRLLFPVCVLLVLFGIGIKSNLKSLLKICPKALTRGLVGMAFALGYSRMKGMGITNLVSISVGESITADSIRVVAEILSELGYLKRA